MSTCRKPPEGWSCTRDGGHDGPCAAVPHNCPACPTEIRNLFAVAHNLVSLVDRRGSPCKISDKIESLRRAVQEVQPLVDEHFKGEGN